MVISFLQQGSLQWRRELAALIIQLAWRQYLRRKLLRQSLRRQRVLHDWTPSVLAARQRALVEKIYGEWTFVFSIIKKSLGTVSTCGAYTLLYRDSVVHQLSNLFPLTISQNLNIGTS